MKNKFKTGLLGLFLLLFAMPVAQAATASADTLLLKRKLHYQGHKIKNAKALRSIVETAHDDEAMSLFRSVKSTSLAGSALVAVGGLCTFFSIGLALVLLLIAIVPLIMSRGKLKKLVRRFNDVMTGRAKAG